MKVSPFERRSEGFPGQRLVIVPPAIVIQASKQPVTRDLCVTHIGHFSAAGAHYVDRPQGTSQHILIACVSGRGSAILDDQEWKLGPGDLLFSPPNHPHIYSSDPRSPWTIFWMHFCGHRAGDYLDLLGVSLTSPVVSVGDPGILFEAFEDTFRHATHGFNASATAALSTSFARLLGLANVHQRTAGTKSKQADSRLLKALTLMRGDLAKSWTVIELAKAACISVPHFTELCTRQTGMPPLALLIRLRLQHAMDLLQQGTHNVAEAASAVGYDDQFYFSRLFHKHMGMTPSFCKKGP
jgi:AraC family transcriptional regulator, arabinose operon regulatory protein